MPNHVRQTALPVAAFATAQFGLTVEVEETEATGEADSEALQAAVRYLDRHRWDRVHHRFWRASVKARQAA